MQIHSDIYGRPQFSKPRRSIISYISMPFCTQWEFRAKKGLPNLFFEFVLMAMIILDVGLASFINYDAFLGQLLK